MLLIFNSEFIVKTVECCMHFCSVISLHICGCHQFMLVLLAVFVFTYLCFLLLISCRHFLNFKMSTLNIFYLNLDFLS